MVGTSPAWKIWKCDEEKGRLTKKYSHGSLFFFL